MINEDDLEALAPGYLEWLEEVEVFHTRHERLFADFAHLNKHDWMTIESWLKAAYFTGYAARNRKEDTL
jgi:hypothetical protein